MGTAKRERQKANRAQRMVEEAETEKAEHRKRTALQVGLGLIAAVAAIVLIVLVSGGFSGDDNKEVATSDDSTPAVITSDAPTGPTTAISEPATSIAQTTIVDATIPEVAATQPATTTPVSDSTAPAAVPTTTNPATTAAPASAPATTTTTGPQNPAPVTPAGNGPCPAADGSSPQQQQFDDAPQMCIDLAKTYTAQISTSMGDITVELYPDKAPLTVNNFVTLARYHYYDNTVCHRIIQDFVIQCGDPTATGGGDPGYSFVDELPADGEYKLGSLAMANSGPNTNGSQFFIITGPNGEGLPPSYSLFGQVTEGLDIAEQIQTVETDAADKPVTDVVIDSVTITES